MKQPLTEIPSVVRVTTKDGLYLHGYYSPGSKSGTTLLHIHGFEGNFYENYFVQVISEHLRKEGVTFLTVNTRGNGRDTDFNTIDGSIKRIGAHYELLEDAYRDIDAWIDFLLKAGYKHVVLQGHSLGTVKAVRYLSEGKLKIHVKKLILLAPFDKKPLVRSFTNTPLDDLLKRAQQKVDEGKGDELITREFDDISFSYRTYVSWYKQDDLGRMFEFCNKDYDFPVLKGIKIPVKVIVGSEDEYFHVSNRDHPEEALEILSENIPNCETVLLKGAKHQYQGHEARLAKEIISFIG